MIISVNKGTQMDNIKELYEVEYSPGKVQKIVKEWEIQIIAATGSAELKSLCMEYFMLNDSSRREDIRREILMQRESSAKKGKSRMSITEKEMVSPSEATLVSSIESTPLEEKHAYTPISSTPEKTKSEEEKKNSEAGDEKESTPNEESASQPDTEEYIKEEIIRQMYEKNITTVDIGKMEKKQWKEIVSEILDTIKTAYAMPPYVPRKPKHTNLVCFNCEKKGHIVKQCPTKTAKCTKKRY